MSDPIITAFEIGVTIGGLSVLFILITASYYNLRRSSAISKSLRFMYFDMIENEKRTVKITVEKTKRKLKLISFSRVSELY